MLMIPRKEKKRFLHIGRKNRDRRITFGVTCSRPSFGSGASSRNLYCLLFRLVQAGRTMIRLSASGVLVVLTGLVAIVLLLYVFCPA